jgi:hypothetical protein
VGGAVLYCVCTDHICPVVHLTFSVHAKKKTTSLSSAVFLFVVVSVPYRSFRVCLCGPLLSLFLSMPEFAHPKLPYSPLAFALRRKKNFLCIFLVALVFACVVSTLHHYFCCISPLSVRNPPGIHHSP